MQFRTWPSTSPSAILLSAACGAPVWVGTSVQERSASTLRLTPRTWPSTRARRFSSSSFDGLYAGGRLCAMLGNIPPWGIRCQTHGGRDLDDRRWPQTVLPDGLRGLVGPGARVRDLGDR